RNA
ncbi:hypothetical protein D030_1782B, partial [Vibrio parahaemolyticus AQ3810]